MVTVEASVHPFPTLEQAAALDAVLARLEERHAVRVTYSTRSRAGAADEFVLMVRSDDTLDLQLMLRVLERSLAPLGLGSTSLDPTPIPVAYLSSPVA